MNQYELTKECWINGARYLSTQLIRLTDVQAKEWLDRKCIKPTKATLQAQLRKQKQAEKNKDASNNQEEQVVVGNEAVEIKEDK